MDMQAALLARLLAEATVFEETNDRIAWVERPSLEAIPEDGASVTLQTISSPRGRHMQGLQTLRRTRVQCDIWARDYGAARRTVEAIVSTLEPTGSVGGIRFRPTDFEGERDLLDATDTATIFRTSIDLIVWHSLA
jgi:hypothetical protein